MHRDNIVTIIEKERGVRAIESDAVGLYYLEDDEKKQLGVLTVLNGKASCVILQKKQVQTLMKELQDVYDVVFN